MNLPRLAFASAPQSAEKAYINVVPAGKEFRVRLTVGVQTFTLQYEAETREEADWMASMLKKALERAGCEVVLKPPLSA